MKIRNGFVSNSSSSSFIVDLGKTGSFCIEGYASVSGSTGLGFTAVLDRDDEDDYDDEIDGHGVFEVVRDYESDKCAFIRSFSQMQDDQTLAQFREETEKKFKEFYGERAKSAKGPKLLIAGDCGNE